MILTALVLAALIAISVLLHRPEAAIPSPEPLRARVPRGPGHPIPEAHPLHFSIPRPLGRIARWLGSRDADGAGEDPDDIPPEAAAERIVERALGLRDTRVWDVMTPRVDVFAWQADRTLAEIAAELPAVRFSRVPVYQESIDNVVGVLYIRDAYQALVSGQRDVALRELAREPFFVPGSIPLLRLLRDFQARRIHLGIVIDEYGGTDGLITLEDILEELVGDILDERDLEDQPIVRLSRNEVQVEGWADLREVNHFFNTAFPLLEHRSMNGYLLDELGRVPAEGEEIEREGVLIRVVEASDTQVLRVRMLRPHADEAAPHPEPGGAPR